MRLDRFLSKTLFETRTTVKKYIRTKRVKVNGEVILKEGYKLDTTLDVVTFDDEVLTYTEFHYFVINKPAGYVCANEDNVHPTIVKYAEEFVQHQVHTIGRLDKDTTGVLLLTNDGKLTHRLISPKTATEKIYIVETDAPISPELITKFSEGFMINDDYMTLPAKLEIISERTAQVTLIEGKFHQVKRMFQTFGLNVINLHRASFATITANDLAVGEYRRLTNEELVKIKNI